MPPWLRFVSIGIVSGIAAGLFGVGGGIVVVPALIYWAGFSQHKATGTSLAVLLPPIGLAAATEYYRHGHVDLPAAMFVAGGMLVGSWWGAMCSQSNPWPIFAVGLWGVRVCLGVYLVHGACRRLGWI